MKELTAIQSELKAPKGQTNRAGGYNYRSCEDILEAVKPLLAKHGAALTLSDEIVQVGNDTFVKATATFYSSAPAPLSVSAFARHPIEKRGMDDSQITGATSSYARKYALNGLFCIDDTKDADAAGDHRKPAPQVRAPGRNQPQMPVSPQERASVMLRYMRSLGVEREEIESAIGAGTGEFNDREYALVNRAARIMKRDGKEFRTAISEAMR